MVGYCRKGHAINGPEDLAYRIVRGGKAGALREIERPCAQCWKKLSRGRVGRR